MNPRNKAHLMYSYQVASVVSTFYNFKDCSRPGSSVCGIVQAKILEWVTTPSSRDLPDPGIKSMSYISCIDAGVPLPLVPPGKPVYLITNYYS